MATLRDIRDRIGSVKNTRKITRAMKLVAGAKLNKATKAALEAQPFQRTLNRTLRRVVGAVGEEFQHPLLTQPANDTVVYVVAISADRGLCGNFNTMLNKAVLAECEKHKAAGKAVKVIAYGKKARTFLGKRGWDIIGGEENVDPSDYAQTADALSHRLVGDLAEDAFSEVVLVFNQYQSIMVQEAIADRVLPMALEPEDSGEDTSDDTAASVDYLFEPNGSDLLGRLLPMALRTRLFQAFLETQAGEQAKRMTAMDSATRNASDLIDRLTLDYNRARQAAITKELIEIVSGAEAL
jgi:F-type H+-transporting ATPase subunit gamma